MIQAIIFDMDGVLVDSEPHWNTAHKKVLAEIGHSPTDEEIRMHAGLRTLDEAKLWQEQFGFTTPSPEKFAHMVEDEVARAVQSEGRPMPGVDAFVKELHEQGVPMAVASSSAMRLILVVLETLSIHKYMRAIHSGEHEKNGKPYPDVFLSTAKTLGQAPENCLVFEDSLNGVKAAKAAGMKCIAVPQQPYNHAAFIHLQPDRIINSLEDIHWADIRAI